jgi:hypothetical protein
MSSTFDHTYALPASNWKASFKKGVVKGYSYSDSKRDLGPISTAKISAGALKILGKGAELSHALAAMPQDVTVVMSSGDVTLCAGVGATSKTTYKVGRSFKGSKPAALEHTGAAPDRSRCRRAAPRNASG